MITSQGPTWILHDGDCLDPVTGMASLPDKSVDHVICDPPYEAEAHTPQRRVLFNGNRPRVEAAALDFGSIAPEERNEIARQMVRVSRGWALAFCQIEAVFEWRAALVAAGAKWRRGCVWVKGGMPQLTGDRPAQGCECVALAWCGEGRSRWNGGGLPGVWTVGHQDDGAREHPTQKPERLMEKLVSLFTEPGETVADPYAGSGTTGVAAIRLGRNFVGWEKSPEYAAIARRRLAAAREQLGLRGVA